MSSAFHLTDVSVSLGGRTILHDLSLDIPAASTTAIVGPNGCGKSTLLRTLSRLQERTGGIHREGRDIGERRPREYAKDVALLPQSPEAPENLPVIDLVSRGRDPHRRWYDQWSEADERVVREALAATGLTDLSERPLGTLSGGQRQRAWIALTLAQAPEVLLLDEPTTYLDVAHQIEVLETVTDLQRRRGITVVMVLHDLGMAVRYADHIIAMQDGRIAAAGPADSTLTPEAIREAFGIDSVILTDPVTGRPVIVPHRAPQTVEGT
ncbi:ABC transporter ATP-binding protein [Brevibacterium casei]|uniref:Iron dicitrate ABC transporter ATP-binding protein n=1 Tax=Brevibacterium casei TaxID=33889 RepID=A0A161S3I6_9MICO|nr:ABC transporter ATP-binding protein [Brevibacterium casei]KZE16131.1 iron dicitrate ABC transporter ATP-binding protein [Brevibacterium casei]MCT1551177.1 ABC transporter ATP-binding protein [Brevibacterium casei]MCT1560260.1 ABC transporter ATP-binding protein [Brevibacterium casei]MCT1767702.1 ABC transporter ATP-binding protein [Brevibacterium casei]MCT2184723.1 ABC transporter ATP-binding protein [Brevibacterium casei]